MFNHGGWWFPDGEEKMLPVLQPPEFEGRLTYQHRKWELARQYVKNWNHAVDIGAHVGLWSRTMVRHFKTIDAFEPLAAHRECYVKNIEPDDLARIMLHPFALGAEPGVAIISSKPSNTGVAHVEIASDGPEWQRFEARVRTLDSFELSDIGFIKIDCEGFELFVLQGGEETIRRERPVMIVEQKPETGKRYGLAQTAAVTLLQSWGAQLRHEFSGDFVFTWP